MTHVERGTLILKLNSTLKLNWTSTLKSSLCYYSDTYILVSGTIIMTEAGADDNAKQLDEINKGVVLKNCAPFPDCISELNNTQIDNIKDLDVVVQMYSLIEYGDNYLKTSWSLWQYYRDNPNDNIINSESFKFKMKTTGKTPAGGNTEGVKIAVPLKYVSNLWRTIEMPLINCEINFTLTWSKNCVIFSGTVERKFSITDTKPYVSDVSTQDNAELLEQLNLVLKEQITGINISQKCQQENKSNI